jgi:hypothetical protein
MFERITKRIGSLLGCFGTQIHHGANIVKDGIRAFRLNQNIQELNANLRRQRAHGKSFVLFVEVLLP